MGRGIPQTDASDKLELLPFNKNLDFEVWYSPFCRRYNTLQEMEG